MIKDPTESVLIWRNLGGRGGGCGEELYEASIVSNHPTRLVVIAEDVPYMMR